MMFWLLAGSALVGVIGVLLAHGVYSAPAPLSRWRHRLSILTVVLVLPLFAVRLYLQLGYPELADAASEAQAVDATIAKLDRHLQRHPDDAGGWRTLLRLQLFSQRPREAVAAAEQAYRLLGDEPELLGLYADALMQAQDGRASGPPDVLAQRALALDPELPIALFLAGLAAAERADRALALAHWSQLQSILGIDPSVTDPAVPAHAGFALSVQVSLAPELATAVRPQDILYVYVRDPAGPPMPMAAVRHPVGEWPITVVLDDSTSLLPQSPLSGLQQGVVGARISRTGHAMPQSGELQADPVTTTLTAGQLIQLHIAHRRP